MSDNETSTAAARTARARRIAAKHGLALRKSRDRRLHLDKIGGFMIVDTHHNAVVAGDRYNLDLGEVEEILAEEERS